MRILLCLVNLLFCLMIMWGLLFFLLLIFWLKDWIVFICCYFWLVSLRIFFFYIINLLKGVWFLLLKGLICILFGILIGFLLNYFWNICLVICFGKFIFIIDLVDWILWFLCYVILKIFFVLKFKVFCVFICVLFDMSWILIWFKVWDFFLRV